MCERQRPVTRLNNHGTDFFYVNQDFNDYGKVGVLTMVQK